MSEEQGASDKAIEGLNTQSVKLSHDDIPIDEKNSDSSLRGRSPSDYLSRTSSDSRHSEKVNDAELATEDDEEQMARLSTTSAKVMAITKNRSLTDRNDKNRTPSVMRKSSSKNAAVAGAQKGDRKRSVRFDGNTKAESVSDKSTNSIELDYDDYNYTEEDTSETTHEDIKQGGSIKFMQHTANVLSSLFADIDAEPDAVDRESYERKSRMEIVEKQELAMTYEQFWSDVGNRKVLRICYHITRSILFWILYTAIIFLEPFLCSYDPYKRKSVWDTQKVFIGIASVGLIFQLGGLMYVKKRDTQFKKQKRISHWLIFTSTRKSSSFVLESTCLLCGWIFIWDYPGIAALRCFRLFRIMWFHELPEALLRPVKMGLNDYLLGPKATDTLFKVMKFASKSLERMSQEMFYLSESTRGGFVLVFMLFYSAYVLGVCMYVATLNTLGQSEDAICYSPFTCMYAMIRLTFFDGDGFDFAKQLAMQHPILFCLVVVYFFLTGIGITNGLIGVFGFIFNTTSDRAFGKLDATQKIEQLTEKVAKLTELLDKHLHNMSKDMNTIKRRTSYVTDGTNSGRQSMA